MENQSYKTKNDASNPKTKLETKGWWEKMTPIAQTDVKKIREELEICVIKSKCFVILDD